MKYNIGNKFKDDTFLWNLKIIGIEKDKYIVEIYHEQDGMETCTYFYPRLELILSLYFTQVELFPWEK